PLLTMREREVLALLADGLSNQAIAERLSLSLHTVAWYLKAIFHKLDVKRRTHAVAVARSLSLLPGVTTNAPFRSTLPASLTPLVGRQTELTQIVECLSQPDTRLLTISGPGGIGKTRLALAAAALWEQLRGVVFFVPLEGIRSVEHVAPAIAQAMSLQFRGQVEPRLQLITALHHRALLLVLDNCEHLLEAVPLFTEMLETCAGLKILATSRERLNQRGETLLQLRGLSYLQDNQHEHNSDAVALFLQHARRSDLRFEPDEDTIRHIADICQLVEGIPLAIELAADWINLLSAAQIVQEIGKGLDILGGSGLDTPQRHSSMEAVFSHSWNLLTETEQAVFKKLSVFHGGFDRAAAEQVAGASLIVLKSLGDKSFVRPEGQGRYRIHELLRQFGAVKLALDATAHQDTQLGHARYYLSHLFQRRRELEGQHSLDVVRELREDMDNIWAAWRTAGEYGLTPEIAQATRSFTILHTSTGLAHTLAQEIEYVLPYLRSQPQLPRVNLALARILSMVSPAYVRISPEQALQLVDEARVYLDRLDRPPDADLAVFHTFRGIALMALEQYEAAVTDLQTAVTICQRIKDNTIAIGWYAPISLSVALIELDRYQHAQGYLETAQNTVDYFEPFFFKAYLQPLLALTACGLMRYDDARSRILEAVALNRTYAYVMTFELLLLATAMYLYRTGSFEPALEMVCMYFHPAMVNLLLCREARNLRNEVEGKLISETRQSISQRAADWLAETPSPENPIGLRPEFFDYVTDLVQNPAKP
ncbi:MAG: LuxR C-terminal-related transcriptional regulator, partial [Chloroflexi bacterium]|nr:LuxR C-terminal-related transcriptional regulator [Chloroflexota bacterium]